MENQNPAYRQAGKKSLPIIVTIVVLAIGALAGLALAVFKDNPLQTKKEDYRGDTTQGLAYKNGDYDITQSYVSPGGTEKFDLSLSIFNDVITSADFTVGAISPTGKNLQEKFSQNFKQYVVGKNIDQITLSAVSGASLTSNAFNQALEQIKQQSTN